LKASLVFSVAKLGTGGIDNRQLLFSGTPFGGIDMSDTPCHVAETSDTWLRSWLFLSNLDPGEFLRHETTEDVNEEIRRRRVFHRIRKRHLDQM